MTEPTELPFVTIAVPTYENERSVEACLRAAVGQDYPRDRLEIVVADGMSMDATREVVLRIGAEDARVRMVDNTTRTRAGALNAILRCAKGEILVPMDPGGEYGVTHVSKCVQALSSSPAEHLAIVPRSQGRTLVERALSAAQSTRLAFAAGAELASSSDPTPALLGAVRRKVFARVGLFDPGTRCEEDVELSHRIAKSGGAITVRRDIVVCRREAASFKELFSQHFVLGKSRARRTVKERVIPPLRTFAPLALVAGGAALLATSSVQPLTAFALAGYALATGAAAVRVGKTEGIVTVPIAWAAYPVMHLAHGVGFGAGLVRALTSPDWSPPEVIGEPEPEPA